MRIRTIDGRRRTTAVLMGTAAAAGLVGLAAAAPPAAADDPPPPPYDTSTTIPETTIPPDTPTTVTGPTTTEVAPPGTVTSTSTTSSTIAEATTTTSGSPTTTGPPGPWRETSCKDHLPDTEYVFEVVDAIETGDTFDDPDSDFSVTFTRVEVVDDHLEVEYDTSHYVPVVMLDAGGATYTTMFFWNQDEGPQGGPHTAVMAPHHGTDLGRARFCFDSAALVGAPEPPAPTTVTSAPQEAIGGTTAPPVTAMVVTPVVEDDPADDGGTLPETGSDVLPVALAGAGLAAVGGGLLVGRRIRRSAA